MSLLYILTCRSRTLFRSKILYFIFVQIYDYCDQYTILLFIASYKFFTSWNTGHGFRNEIVWYCIYYIYINIEVVSIQFYCISLARCTYDDISKLHNNTQATMLALKYLL